MIDTCEHGGVGLFSRKSRRPDEPGDVGPTPFVATLCERLGVAYGGWDALGPLPPGAGGPGMQLVFHVDDGTPPRATHEGHGTGITREARVFADRTEVWDDGTLVARWDDLTTADVFGER